MKFVVVNQHLCVFMRTIFMTMIYLDLGCDHKPLLQLLLLLREPEGWKKFTRVWKIKL